jgi:CRISPR-associated protein Cas2
MPAAGWWEAAFRRAPTPSELAGHPCGHSCMLTLVAYDITDNKRLSKVAKHCANFGVRVQYSIFECQLESDAFDRFWKGLTDLIDEDSDRLVAYKVCAACAKEIRDAGQQLHHPTKVVAYIF